MYIFLFKLMKQFGSIYIHNSKLKDQLQEFNQNLEQVVAMRTKELSDANYVLSKGLQTVSHVQKNFLPPEQLPWLGLIYLLSAGRQQRFRGPLRLLYFGKRYFPGWTWNFRRFRTRYSCRFDDNSC